MVELVGWFGFRLTDLLFERGPTTNRFRSSVLSLKDLSEREFGNKLFHSAVKECGYKSFQSFVLSVKHFPERGRLYSQSRTFLKECGYILYVLVKERV